MEKQELQKTAGEIFKVHKGIDKIYLTADGQGFTDENRAIDHARILKDKDVHSFVRGKEEKDEVLTDINPKAENPFDYENVDKELLEDREFLIARYEALEGKKPAHNIGTDKLAEKVQELENERFNPKTE